MNWIVNALACIILTSITGSVLFVGWFFLGKIIERQGYVNVMYPMLRVVMVFYMIPFVYIILLLSDKGGVFGGDLFLHTTELLTAGRVLHFVWFLSIMSAAVYFIYDWIELMRAHRSAFECSIPVQNYFDKICEELSIPVGKVTLAQSYRAKEAFIRGVFRPKVILPVKSFSDSDLRVMFVHELNHYKQKDNLHKIIAIMIVIFQCWNPLAWLYLKKFEEWAEYSCDFKSFENAGGAHCYFGTIIRFLEKGTPEKRFFRMTIAKDKKEIQRRVERMKSYNSPKLCSKKQIAWICAMVMLISSTSVFAASVGIGMAYQKMYEATEVVEVEVYETENGIEYEERGIEPNIKESEGETEWITYGTVKGFSWTVASDARRYTSSFSASSGQQIIVTAVMDPTDKTVDVGIIEPDGTRRYVQGSDVVTHTFNLDQSGYYRVFVENHNSTSIEASGSYQVR